MERMDAIQNYFPMIREMNLFRFLSDEDLLYLLFEAEVVFIPKGEKVIRQGEVSPHLYVVLKGEMDVSATDIQKDVFLNKIKQGDVFGEAAVFMTEKRTASVTASEDAAVIRMHRADILHFIKKRNRAGIKILMLIIHSLLNKLRASNMEYVMEKQSLIDLDDIDPLIQEIMDDEDDEPEADQPDC